MTKRFLVYVAYGPPWQRQPKWVKRFWSDDYHDLAHDIAEWWRGSILPAPSPFDDVPSRPDATFIIGEDTGGVFSEILDRELQRVLKEVLDESRVDA